jgi:protein TIF31
VNVFLPFTRSIEGIDKGSHETLKQDEEEARRMARHLWDVVIPNLSKDIRSSSVNGLQIPADGRSLTELMHQRGINCRYLGRLADLARKEELEDNIALEKTAAAAASNVADKQSIIPARFRMPICWLELLECEMVARAAKHVLDSYMIERASSQPAQCIASFLSAIMSVGEESAGETELRTIKAHSGPTSFCDQDEMNGLTLCFGSDDEDKGSDTVAFTGRVQIWSDIEREIGRRYRYALSLYNTKTSAKKDVRESRALFMPLLRRICQRSGIRLVARKYEVGKKCVCVGGRGLTATYPIAPTDVLDVLPLVKHAASGELLLCCPCHCLASDTIISHCDFSPVSGESFAPCSFNNSVGSSLHVLLPDAKTRYEVAHESFLTDRNDTLALDYALEASAMYQQVLDSPLHPQISKCLRLIGEYLYLSRFSLVPRI